MVLQGRNKGIVSQTLSRSIIQRCASDVSNISHDSFASISGRINERLYVNFASSSKERGGVGGNSGIVLTLLPVTQRSLSNFVSFVNYLGELLNSCRKQYVVVRLQLNVERKREE